MTDISIQDDDHYDEDEIEEDEEEELDRANASLEDLADYCDMNAESCNNGTYVGTHRILAAFLHRHLGRTVATKLLFEISEYGGLDAMSGVGCSTDAFADFGIEDYSHDWKLEDTKGEAQALEEHV